MDEYISDAVDFSYNKTEEQVVVSEQVEKFHICNSTFNLQNTYYWHFWLAFFVVCINNCNGCNCDVNST